MRTLSGKVAVVTGGASGIGLAMVEAFLGAGMRVVVADVEQEALDRVGGLLEGVVPVRTDVSDAASVEALANVAYERFGACHLLCNNAGVGAPSAQVWETTPNDWRWVFGVNVTGVVNGILSFVPRMLAAGEEGHVVNTSSSDGPIAPLPTASVYAASKAAVSVLTECLAAQLAETAIGVSVFYPSGGLLRTGLWTAERTRPPELAREQPRPSAPMTPERLEEMARAAGNELTWQPLDELAAQVVAGVHDGRFVIMVDPERAAATLRQRADAFERRERPAAHSR